MIQPPVSHRITVKNGEADQEIFMSFGLLNRLTRLLGNVDQLPLLAVDPELQELVLVEIFTQRNPKGDPTYIPSLDEIHVSLDDVSRIIDFVGDHISNFFTQTAQKAQQRALVIHEKMAKMSASMPTKAGS